MRFSARAAPGVPGKGETYEAESVKQGPNLERTAQPRPRIDHFRSSRYTYEISSKVSCFFGASGLHLTVENLKCDRGGRRIFDNVSFELEPGQSLVVTGRNGAGKSTLLAILAGRLKATGGKIALSGVQERTLPECLHLIGHREALKAAMTARENLEFAARLLGDALLSAEQALERVGLPHAADMPVAYLSAGQKRRVALARLLVAHRPLWLLDEPTSALDVASQQMLFDLLNEHVAKGGMIMAATHQEMPLDNLRELRIERSAPRSIETEFAEGAF